MMAFTFDDLFEGNQTDQLDLFVQALASGITKLDSHLTDLSPPMIFAVFHNTPAFLVQYGIQGLKRTKGQLSQVIEAVKKANITDIQFDAAVYEENLRDCLLQGGTRDTLEYFLTPQLLKPSEREKYHTILKKVFNQAIENDKFVRQTTLIHFFNHLQDQGVELGEEDVEKAFRVAIKQDWTAMLSTYSNHSLLSSLGNKLPVDRRNALLQEMLLSAEKYFQIETIFREYPAIATQDLVNDLLGRHYQNDAIREFLFKQSIKPSQPEIDALFEARIKANDQRIPYVFGMMDNFAMLIPSPKCLDKVLSEALQGKDSQSLKLLSKLPQSLFSVTSLDLMKKAFIQAINAQDEHLITDLFNDTVFIDESVIDDLFLDIIQKDPFSQPQLALLMTNARPSLEAREKAFDILFKTPALGTRERLNALTYGAAFKPAFINGCFQAAVEMADKECLALFEHVDPRPDESAMACIRPRLIQAAQEGKAEHIWPFFKLKLTAGVAEEALPSLLALTKDKPELFKTLLKHYITTMHLGNLQDLNSFLPVLKGQMTEDHFKKFEAIVKAVPYIHGLGTSVYMNKDTDTNIAESYANGFNKLLKPIAIALLEGVDKKITAAIEENKKLFVDACIDADKDMPRSLWIRFVANLAAVLFPVFGIIAILGKTLHSYYKASQTGLTGKLGVFGASTEQEQVESLKKMWDKNLDNKADKKLDKKEDEIDPNAQKGNSNKLL